jgi:hypothetical protein
MLYPDKVWSILDEAFSDLVIVYSVLEVSLAILIVILKRDVFLAIWTACVFGRARPRHFWAVDKCGYITEGIACSFVMVALFISGVFVNVCVSQHFTRCICTTTQISYLNALF